MSNKRIVIILVVMLLLGSIGTDAYAGETVSVNTASDHPAMSEVAQNPIPSDDESDKETENEVHEEDANETVSVDDIKTETLSENAVSENAVSENTVSENTVSDNSVSDDDLPVSENSSENKMYGVSQNGVSENSYTIIFDGNGATGGSMEAQTCPLEASCKLKANKYTLSGNRFVSWNIVADGSGQGYADGEEVTDLCKNDGEKITLYAQWEVGYNITYELYGGKNDASNPSSYKMETPTFEFKAASRNGYVFSGWYLDDKFTTKITRLEEGSTGDKTLYAKWTANKYAIKYNGNGATSGTMKKQTSLKYGTAYKLTANAFKKKGYKFASWNTKKNGSGTKYANKASVKSLTAKNGATINLYAQWKIVTYTITYKLNGGKNNASNPTKYKVTTKTKKLKAPTKKGYTFGGWFSDSKYKKKVTQIKKGSTGNKTLYAKWTVNKYTIHYSGNGATDGDMDDQKGLKYGQSYKLKTNEYKRTGYKFKGWNTKRDGSGKSYKDKATVKSLTSKNGETVKLYAQWKKEDDATAIWSFLEDKIGNEYGTAGLMGNLYAESNLRSNNLQNSYNYKFGVSDEEYTDAVDNGSYNNFVYDQAGYGLAQWTYYTRKQGLLDYAREKGESIGDLGIQLEYLWKELSEAYTGVLDTLRNASSVREASDKVLTSYERPADQSESAKERRSAFGKAFYERFVKK